MSFYQELFLQMQNEEEEEEEVKMFENMGIPDTILKQFNEQCPISNLLENAQRFDRKTYIFYKYNKLITYRATIYNYYYGLEQKRQLTIKLSYDGFRYHARKFKMSGINWHNREGFFILDETVLKEMPFLQQLKQDLDCKLIFYYNIKHKRMDIRLKKDGDHILMVTFEPGKREYDVSDDLYI